MSKSSLMSSTALLSEEDRALLNETAAPDLPTEMKNLIVHVQAISKELVAGDPKEFIPRAGEHVVAGDFLLPHNGERILVKGAVGYDFLVVAGDQVFVEYKQMRGGWVANHLEKPADASWFERGDSPDGKAGLYRVGVDDQPGNRVEETIYAHMLILPGNGDPALHCDASVPRDGGRRRAHSDEPGVSQSAWRRGRQSGSLQMAHDDAIGAERRVHLSQAAGDPAWQVRRAQWRSDHRAGSSRRSIAQGVQDRRKLGSASRAAIAPSRRPIRQRRSSSASHTSASPKVVTPTIVAGRSPSPAGVRR